MNVIMCNVFPTFFHPQLWHSLHYNSTTLVFYQCVPFTTNDFFFVFNQWTHSTLHHIYKPSLEHQAPCPWHVNCLFNLEFASVVIRLFWTLPSILLLLTKWNKTKAITLKIRKLNNIVVGNDIKVMNLMIFTMSSWSSRNMQNYPW